MKKILFYLIIIVGIICPAFVYAQEYQTGQLIPVDSSATVKTEKFTYQEFLYNSGLDAKGNAKITFNSIINNTVSKTPISINLLLFGEDQRNIGIVTYCTDKDISSNYDGFKLNGGQSVPFSINVVKNKYFIEGKGPGDVKYIAVLDDNKYCKIGGYSNYEGLTIDEIVNGVGKKNDNDINLYKYVEKFQESGLVNIVFIILGIFVGFIIYGMIVNVLYKKMHGNTTKLAYLPIANIYVTFELVFGRLIGLIAMIISIVAILLFLINISIFIYIFGIIDIIVLIVAIIKGITGNYSLLSFDGVNNKKEKPIDNNGSDISESQEALDLSYDDVSTDTVDTTSMDVSSGEAVTNTDDLVEEEKEEEKVEEEKKEDDESDLSKFFG